MSSESTNGTEEKVRSPLFHCFTEVFVFFFRPDLPSLTAYCHSPHFLILYQHHATHPRLMVWEYNLLDLPRAAMSQEQEAVTKADVTVSKLEKDQETLSKDRTATTLCWRGTSVTS